MDVTPEVTDLIRALARSDWGTTDRLLDDQALEQPGAVQTIGIAFAVAVQRRFGHATDPARIARFVADLRKRYAEGRDLPALETEGLIRAALGEPDLLDNITPDVYIPAQIVVLGTLLRDDISGEDQLEDFIGEVKQAVAQYL